MANRRQPAGFRQGRIARELLPLPVVMTARVPEGFFAMSLFGNHSGRGF